MWPAIIIGIHPGICATVQSEKKDENQLLHVFLSGSGTLIVGVSGMQKPKLHLDDKTQITLLKGLDFALHRNFISWKSHHEMRNPL